MIFELELGWNGYTGFGPRIDVLLYDNFTLNAGAGLAYWGYRLSGAFRYYLNHPYGLAFSTGVVYNSGYSQNATYGTFDTVNGSIIYENINFYFKSVICINATLLYSFKLKDGNKIYIESGYSHSFTKEQYTYKTESGRKMANESEDIEDLKINEMLSYPGGLIISIGYGLVF